MNQLFRPRAAAVAWLLAISSGWPEGGLAQEKCVDLEVQPTLLSAAQCLDLEQAHGLVSVRCHFSRDGAGEVVYTDNAQDPFADEVHLGSDDEAIRMAIERAGSGRAVWLDSTDHDKGCFYRICRPLDVTGARLVGSRFHRHRGRVARIQWLDPNDPNCTHVPPPSEPTFPQIRTQTLELALVYDPEPMLYAQAGPVQLERLEIHGGGVKEIGVYLEDTTPGTALTDVFITKVTQAGLLVKGADGGTFDGLQVTALEPGADGAVFVDSRDVAITSSSFRSGGSGTIGRHGVVLATENPVPPFPASITLRGSILEANHGTCQDGSGVVIDSVTGPVMIEANWFEANDDRDILVKSSTDVAILHNRTGGPPGGKAVELRGCSRCTFVEGNLGSAHVVQGVAEEYNLWVTDASEDLLAHRTLYQAGSGVGSRVGNKDKVGVNFVCPLPLPPGCVDMLLRQHQTLSRWSSGPFTNSTWLWGDIIWNAHPGAGEPIGWSCASKVDGHEHCEDWTVMENLP